MNLVRKHFSSHFYLLLLAFVILQSPVHALSSCEKYLGNVAAFILPTRSEYRPWRYERAMDYWKKVLNERDSETPLSLFELLKEKGEATPETLMALLDSLQKDPAERFGAELSKFETTGIKLIWRDRGALGESSDMNLRHEWKWKRRLLGKNKNLIKAPIVLKLDLSDSVPQTSKELYGRIYALSNAIFGRELKVQTSRVPWFSLPFGKHKGSYPKQTLNAVEKMDEKIYRIFDDVERIEGTRNFKLPSEKVPAPWISDPSKFWQALGWVSLLPKYAWRSVFPFYDLLQGHKPNEKGYEAYRAGILADYVKDRFWEKSVRKYLSENYFRGPYLAGLAMLALSLPQKVMDGYEFFASGQAKAALKSFEMLKENMQDPNWQREAIIAYRNRPGGDPQVNEHFTGLIEEVEKGNLAPSEKKAKIDALLEEWKAWAN